MIKTVLRRSMSIMSPAHRAERTQPETNVTSAKARESAAALLFARWANPILQPTNHAERSRLREKRYIGNHRHSDGARAVRLADLTCLLADVGVARP